MCIFYHSRQQLKSGFAKFESSEVKVSAIVVF